MSIDDKLCQQFLLFCGYPSGIISELQIPSISENVPNITDPVLATINMLQDHQVLTLFRMGLFRAAREVRGEGDKKVPPP